MLAQAVVTEGYLWAVILVLWLWLTLNGKRPCPTPVDDRNNVTMFESDVATMLAYALAVGIVIVVIVFVRPTLLPEVSGIAVWGLR